MIPGGRGGICICIKFIGKYLVNNEKALIA